MQYLPIVETIAKRECDVLAVVHLVTDGDLHGRRASPTTIVSETEFQFELSDFVTCEAC